MQKNTSNTDVVKAFMVEWESSCRDVSLGWNMATLRRIHSMPSYVGSYWMWGLSYLLPALHRGLIFHKVSIQILLSQAGHVTAEFPKTASHFRNVWLWGLSWKLFVTRPKIISSLPEGPRSQNINLSFFISVSAEFSRAPRWEATCSWWKLLRSNLAPHMPKCFRKETKTSSPPGWLLKGSRGGDGS